MNRTEVKDKAHLDRMLGDVVDQYLRQLANGEQPDAEQYALDHPEIASMIREAFPVLKVVNYSLGDGPRGDGLDLSGSKQLGDFRLLHPLGSGGMGVVYEAQQISMGRHVALKILPMAGALQQKQLQRFRNEVRAAAMLDHPHIVSVYSIGEDRGVHFFAMQLIRGQSLAEVIGDLQRFHAGEGPLSGPLTGASIHQVLSLSIARPAGARASAGASVDQPTEEYSSKSNETPSNERATAATVEDFSSELDTDTRPEVKGQISTAASTKQDRGFFRSAAKLGIQAAEALQHAHDLGVLHRDIKPGNLMLDAEAQLHITDFGLARIEADAGVTMTGDILGTLRYMSPEQALAKRVVIDQHSDIYSLGVTLYELLTLQPAFSGNDRQSLLHQIAFEEPKRPTRINRAIPRELETIVMKAIAKNPRERYATAQELADDLGRYLDDMPIHAKPPSLLQRSSKWSHRNRTFVRTAMATVAIALLIGGALLWQQRSRTLAALDQAEQNAAQAEANLVLANDATKRETWQRELALANLALAQKNAEDAQQNAAQAERERIVADENFRRTRAAVDDYFTTVSQNKLLDVPDMEPLRQELLESAVAYYEQFTKEHADDPELAAELAAAHVRLGHVYNDQGSTKWIAEAASTIDIVERLVNQGADVSGWKSLREGVWFKNAGSSADSVALNAKELAELFSLCDRGIPVWEKLVEAHPNVAGFTSDLAGLHFIRGLFGAGGSASEVTRANEQAIANWERLSYDELGPTRWVYLAVTHSFLGEEYGNKQEWELALRSHERVLQMLADPDRCPQLYRSELALLRLRLSYTYFEQAAIALGRPQLAIEKNREAVQCFRRVEEEQRKQFGDDSPQVYAALGRLSDVLSRQVKYYADQGMDEEAAEAERELSAFNRELREAEKRAPQIKLVQLEQQRKQFGNESREVAETLHDLGHSHWRNDNSDGAEKAYREAVAIYRNLAGNHDDAYAHILGHLAQTLTQQDKYGQAENVYLQSLEIFKRTLGEEHPETLTSINNLGMNYLKQGKYDQAEELFLPTLEISKRTLGEEHIDTLSFMNNLAVNYDKQAQYDQAEKLFLQTLEIRKRTLGEQHRDTLRAMMNLARFYEAQAQYDQAEKLHLQTLEIRKRTLGEEHADTLGNMSELAGLYNAQGQYGQAGKLFSKMLEIRKRTIDGDHPDKVASMKELNHNYYFYALTQLDAGDGEGYRKTCAAMLEQFAETEDAQTANFTAWSCALADGAVDDYSIPITLAERVVAKDPGNDFYLKNLGAVLYRAGRFDGALVRLDEAASLQGEPDAQANSSAAYTWYFLAMTHYRLGNVDEARKWYEKAAAWTSVVLAPESEDGTAKPPVTWNRRLTLELLDAETEQLLGIAAVETTPEQAVAQ